MGERVGLDRQPLAGMIEELELVEIAQPHARQEDFPDPVARVQAHDVAGDRSSR